MSRPPPLDWLFRLLRNRDYWEVQISLPSGPETVVMTPLTASGRRLARYLQLAYYNTGDIADMVDAERIRALPASISLLSHSYGHFVPILQNMGARVTTHVPAELPINDHNGTLLDTAGIDPLALDLTRSWPAVQTRHRPMDWVLDWRNDKDTRRLQSLPQAVRSFAWLGERHRLVRFPSADVLDGPTGKHLIRSRDRDGNHWLLVRAHSPRMPHMVFSHPDPELVNRDARILLGLLAGANQAAPHMPLNVLHNVGRMVYALNFLDVWLGNVQHLGAQPTRRWLGGLTYRYGYQPAAIRETIALVRDRLGLTLPNFRPGPRPPPGLSWRLN